MIDAKVVETPDQRALARRALAAGRADAAGAGDPRLRRARPQQPGDRRRAGAHQARRREAHQRDLPQARPHRGARRQPPRQGGADLPRREPSQGGDAHPTARTRRAGLPIRPHVATVGPAAALAWQPGAPAAASRAPAWSPGWRSALGAPARRRHRPGRGHPRLRAARSSSRRSSAVLNAVLPPLVAALPPPVHRRRSASCSCSRSTRRCCCSPPTIVPEQLEHRRLLGRAASSRSSPRRSARRSAPSSGIDDDDGYTLRVARRVARRTGRPIADGRAGHPVPRDRRARAAGAAARDPGRHDAQHGALARRAAATGCSSGRPTCPRRPAPARPGSCWGTTTTSPRSAGSTRPSGRLVTCSNPDDCAAIERDRSSGPGLLADGGTSRGNLLSGEADAAHPHRQPGGRREVGQSGLPRVPGQRQERHAHARARAVGARPRARRGGAAAPAGRAPARAPRRHLPADPRRDVRVRARPDRVLGAAGHVPRRPRRLRDVLELRRGRPSLGARAPRHDRGAAQARPALRA